MGHTFETKPSKRRRVEARSDIVFQDKDTLRQRLQRIGPQSGGKQDEYNASQARLRQYSVALDDYLEQTKHMILNATSMGQMNLIVESRSQGRARLERMVSGAESEVVYFMSKLFTT